jgi:hypothetical protein
MYNFGALRRRQSRFEAVPGFQYAYAVKGRSLDMCARRRPLLDYSNAGERIAYLKWELKRLEDSFGYTHEWMHSRVKGASSVNQKKVFLMEGRQILDGLYLAKYEVLKALARQA